MTTPSIIIKRGDTIRWPVLYEDSAGTPVNLTGYGIKAHVIRAFDRVDVATLTPTLADQGTSPGQFELLLTDTSSLSGAHVVDVRFTEPDTDSVSTQSWGLVVEPEVTPR